VHNKHFAVAVIGAGPAGTSAAHTLASHGIQTCIIDKCQFPRDKLCGGLLTLRSKKIFDRVFSDDWDQVLHTTAHGVKFFYRNSVLPEVPPYSEIYFTQRKDYDQYLLQLAARKGAVLILGTSAKEFNLSKRHVFLADGSTISYDVLIGADGVNSLVSRSLFGKTFRQDKIGFALEIEVDRGESRCTAFKPEIHMGAARWGYAWVFPKRETLTVGIGGIHKYNPDLKERFRQFINARFDRLPDYRIRGYFVPFGAFKKHPGREDILLCGDAAGLVDSLTGEGIAFAMESGHAAALAALDRLRNKSKMTAYELYLPHYRTITNTIRLSNRYRPLVFARLFEPIFAKLLSDATTLQYGFLDILADAKQYSDLPTIARRQAYLGCKKGIRWGRSVARRYLPANR
jgi:menaquinone-9 beta-reductase